MLELVSVALLFPLLLAGGRGPATVLISAAAFGVFFYFWLDRYRHAASTRRALGFEELFLRQALDPIQARLCARRGDHLWSRSVLRDALRGALARPLPGLLTPRERAKRLQPYFQRTLQVWQPRQIGLEFVIPVVAVGKVLSAGWLSSPQSLYTSALALLLLAGLAASALAQRRLSRRIRRRLSILENALAAWAERDRLYNVRFNWQKLHALVLSRQLMPRTLDPAAVAPEASSL